MIGTHRHICSAISLLFALAAFLFFGLRCPYHIHFQEQYQLFEWTSEHFCSVAGVPGGLADWCGSFLTQFFYYAWAGAAILALLLAGVQLATWWLFREKNLISFAMSFLPAIVCWAFLCSEYSLAGTVVALIFCLLAAKAAQKAGTPLGVAAVPFVYFACGPLALAYVAIVPMQKRKAAAAIGSLAILALCIFASARIFHYTPERLSHGIHYVRDYALFPTLPWCAAALAVLATAASGLKWPESRITTTSWLGAACLAVLAAFSIPFIGRFEDSDKENMMKYDFYVRMGMWNRIMQTADREKPTGAFQTICVNTALARSGRMADHMFEYYQNGTDGLLPAFAPESFGPLAIGEAFWQMGMVNTAQRYTFEAQEAIRDYRKSSRCYKRLAETNIVNGDYMVAQKYLNSLKNTVFYKKWALETEKLLSDEQAINAHEEYGRLRKMRLKEHDFLFSQTEMDSMIGILYTENRQNSIAYNYLMAWCLLSKNLPRFLDCLQLASFPHMPKSYQEAYLLDWTQNNALAEGIPSFIDREHVTRIDSFIRDARAGKSLEEMERLYSDTYWFYYFYRGI